MMDYLDEIRDHFDHWYPQEGCGLLGVKSGKMHWIPCDNIAVDASDEFIIPSAQYFEAKKEYDIVAVVHSHPDATCTPSRSDIAHCNATGLKYVIFNYPEMDMHVIEPEWIKKPLIGRVYEFGVSDCFEAARDYYREVYNIELPQRGLYEDDWWIKGIDYFTEPYINSWGFEKVDTPEPGDLLIFAMGTSTVGNHCGVYIGDEKFYHHAENRLSCRENLHPMWAKGIIGVYRYAA